jgi:prophage regulatory protein
MSRIIRKEELDQIVPLSDMQRRRLEARGEFPKRFVITPGGRAVGWLESEVDEWIAARAAAREPIEA